MLNPQIPLMSQSENQKICKEKGSVSDPDPHWLASNIFYLGRYILDYEMPCNSCNSKNLRICGFAELICGLPTFAYLSETAPAPSTTTV
jgi:hypothetical protein